MRACIGIAIGAIAVITASDTFAREASSVINVPAQPLSVAIAALGRQTAVEVLLNVPGEERRHTRAVRGRMSVKEALSRMTQGLGLAVRAVAPGVYLISRAPERTRQPSGQSAAAAAEAPDILVSARRRPELDLDVPVLVSHLDASALEGGAVRTLADLARMTAGFVATGQTSSATPLLVMRGQRRAISDENRLPLVVWYSFDTTFR